MREAPSRRLVRSLHRSPTYLEREPAAGAEPCCVFSGPVNPFLDPPTDAVAWRVRNPDIDHIDGPFSIPGRPNPCGFPPRDPDPARLVTATWANPDQCMFIHLHGFFDHTDPAPFDDPTTPEVESPCGHGGLEWGIFSPF
jgi:hypothetical protein